LLVDVFFSTCVMANSKTSNKHGRFGESLATGYLRSLGYFILERNWRCQHKEIDLIASDGETAVFVEVKFRTGKQYGEAEEFVDERKMNFMIDAADQWLEKTNWEGDLRFDIVAITAENSKYQIEHIPNAFQADLS